MPMQPPDGWHHDDKDSERKPSLLLAQRKRKSLLLFFWNLFISYLKCIDHSVFNTASQDAQGGVYNSQALP